MHLGRKTLSLLLTLAMLAGLLPLAAMADTPTTDWIDYRADSFATVDDVNKTITVASEAELALLAHNVNNGNDYRGWEIRLEEDLDLKNHMWTPIGTDHAHAFAGSFYGGRHTVSGLNVHVTVNEEYPDVGQGRFIYGFYSTKGTALAGLFGFVDVGGEVSHLKVSGTVTATAGVQRSTAIAGGIVAFNRGLVEFCEIRGGTVKTDSLADGHEHVAGGVVGFNYGHGSSAGEGGAVYKCCNSGASVVGEASAGGVVGRTEEGPLQISSDPLPGQVVGCYSYGGVKVSAGPDGSSTLYVGGVVGYVSGALATQCYQIGGEVSASATDEAAAGGVVGNIEGSGKVTNCYQIGGRITESGAKASPCAGGVVGRLDSQTSDCFDIGSTVTATNDQNELVPAGAVIGYAHTPSNMEHCYFLKDEKTPYGIGRSSLNQESLMTALTAEQFAAKDSFPADWFTIIDQNVAPIWTMKDGAAHPVLATVPCVLRLTADEGMSLTSGKEELTFDNGGDDTRLGEDNEILFLDPIIYTAEPGWYFPDDYAQTAVNGAAGVNGIKVQRDSASQITVCGQLLETSVITLAAATPNREATPTAAFTATGPDSGALSGLIPAKGYTVTGAGVSDYAVTADAEGKYLIPSGMETGSLSVVRKGNGSTTTDSLVQTIAVTRAAAPANLSASGCTASANDDGQITGLDPNVQYEYRAAADTAYTAAAEGASAITGLADGSYYVRVRAAGTVLASPDSAALSVAKYVQTAWTVTVVNGTGGGVYTVGADVTVTAITPSGQQFDKWTSDDGVAFADENAETTTFVMPAKNVTVTATFKDAESGEEENQGAGEDVPGPAPDDDDDETPNHGSLANFRRIRVYKSGMFRNVDESAWYFENVKAAVEFAFMEGMGDGTFGIGENLKLSEALALAARMHSIYYGGSGEFDQTQGETWYQVYEDYAVKNGIIRKGQYDPEAPATRAQFAEILSAALPSEAFAPVNRVTALPDVAADDPRLPAILRLYSAGILTGVDAKGNFAPDAPILREQIAAMATRVADPALRKSLT